jgi:peptide/nickel transport system substrate-binding protein
MNRRLNITLSAFLLLGTALASSLATAQDLPNVPRNRTFISQGWDFYNQVPSPNNFNPYAGVLLHQRNSLHYTVNEMLFYTNHNTNEIIPWQAESYRYNDPHTEITLKLRSGVKWSDGQAFTAEDVAFTFDMLKAVAPDLVLSSAIKEWVAKAEVVDPLTLKITLTKPGPRFVQDFLAQGQATRFVVVPKHIWKDQDAKTFGFFDLAKGWPVGTGPYKLVKSDATSIIFDRRPNWWAVEAKVAPAMPAPERVIYHPAAVEALPQLFTNNDIDVGRALQVGAFEAARARNPGLISWNKSGPVWGAADGCTFRLIFNTQKPPFDDAEVRHAMNYALDRDKIVDIAYEGSTPKAVLPFASYDAMKAYTAKLTQLPEAKDLDRHDPKRVDAVLTAKKFKKDANGRWTKPNGEAWPITILIQVGYPTGPVLTDQLKAAGFDVVFQALQDGPFFDTVANGNFEMALGTHCGSVYDPWQTLEHFHSKYSAAPGQKVANVRTLTRYANKELDQLLDQMEARIPSPTDAKYQELVSEATKIVIRDQPEITLAEEFHVITFNSTYWKGYPSAESPYVAPYLPWEGFNLIVDRLQPTGK